MSSRIQWALKNHRLVTLADVQRGERGLTCYTCKDRLVVKDGAGQFVKREGSRHSGRGKHFSHTSNSGCHGEGPAHFNVKQGLCRAINRALTMPMTDRNMHGQLSYLCPDPYYGPNDVFKSAPGSGTVNRQFEEMQHGYHSYDLLQNLHCAKSEVSLAGGRTRADIAGLDKQGNVLWIIEIQRTTLSKAATDHAQEQRIPLFVIDLTHLPQATADSPMAETECPDYFILEDNLARGFYPSVSKSFNTECERKAFGMGPADRLWRKVVTLVHRGLGECSNEGCSDCEEVVLHECGEMLCPDISYIFAHGLDYREMYTDPAHRLHSHSPPSTGQISGNAAPIVTKGATEEHVIVQEVSNHYDD